MAKKKRAVWQIIAIILYLIAVAWNINSGGMHNLEIGIGALVLGLVKIWEDYIK